MVRIVAAILARGEPTYFRHEGDCRHALRSLWCLEGTPWARADLWAEQVVAAALASLGAERPLWIEGQPEHYTNFMLDRGYCYWCGAPFVRVGPGTGITSKRYCSSSCMSKHRRHNGGADGDKIRANGRRDERKRIAKLRECQPEKPCEHCGRPFKPLVYPTGYRPPSRFCSIPCRNRAINDKRRAEGRSFVPVEMPKR